MLPSTNITAKSEARRQAETTERRRQVRGLLVLAAIAIAFSIFRAGVHRVFTAGWWRLW